MALSPPFILTIWVSSLAISSSTSTSSASSSFALLGMKEGMLRTTDRAELGCRARSRISCTVCSSDNCFFSSATSCSSAWRRCCCIMALPLVL
uniref:Secreted protein n=1 Tax=Arundo donax TaxID=35708 RepID=A0A0A9D3J5_ARUDO